MQWVLKTWGAEQWVVNNDKYCCKFLHFIQNTNCSLHCHHDKHETFYIAEGSFVVFLYDNIKHNSTMLKIGKGEVLTIQPYLYHSMRALGGDQNIILETSTHHDDDDSYRIKNVDLEFEGHILKAWKQFLDIQG